MASALPLITLVRHGETAWSLTGQHTGHTDIPLTAQGETDAAKIGVRLQVAAFDAVWTSPLQRARRTAECAGYGAAAKNDPDLMEWNYGDYEGRRTVDIQRDQPHWSLFADGVPNGESLAAVSSRADHVIHRLRTTGGNILLFSHGHFLRILAARWIGLSADNGRSLLLSTATVSVLGYDHSFAEPAIRVWNDGGHLER